MTMRVADDSETTAEVTKAVSIGEKQPSQAAWCSWGGWAVCCVIDDQRAKQARDEASTRLIPQIRREKEEARGSVDAFLSEVGAGSLREYSQGLMANGERETTTKWEQTAHKVKRCAAL